MEPEAEIDVILFDVGGVLVTDGIDEKLADLAAKYDIEGEELTGHKDELRLLADRGDIPDAEFWRLILSRQGVAAEEEDLDFDAYLRPIRGSLELARRLAARHRVGILSNDSVEMGRRRREKFGFDEVFNPIIISSAVGMVKPAIGIFHHAAKTAGLAPGECLFIDNMQANVDGARLAGMRAILFEDAAQLESELSNLGLLEGSIED